MPIFSGLAQSFASLFLQTPPEMKDTPQHTCIADNMAEQYHFAVTQSDSLHSKKRKAEEPPSEDVKRLRLTGAPLTPESQSSQTTRPFPTHNVSPSPDSRHYTSVTKTQVDRALMPPPATPGRAKAEQTRRMSRKSMEMEDDMSETSYMSNTAARRTLHELGNFDMELARRQAEATALPENSGVWAEGEKALFYHLSLR